MPSIKALPRMRVESIHRAAAIPRKKVKQVAMADAFRDIHNGDKSNSIFGIKKTGRLKPRLHEQNPPPWVEEQAIKIMLFYSQTGRLKPRLHRQNPPPWVEEQAIKIRLFYSQTGRLKPRLHRQNPPPWVEEQAVKIRLFYSVRGGGLRLCRRGFNRRLNLTRPGG